MEQLQQSPETLQSEIEVKYLVNPNRFPPDLLKALENGDDHQDILRKGRITQLYLPVTEDNQRIALDIIQDHPEIALSPQDIQHFSDIRNIDEIRILQREELQAPVNDDFDLDISTKGKVRIPDSFQITIKGKANTDGSSRPNIETPITTNLDVCDAVVDLLERSLEEDWTEADNKVEKMWYDIKIPNPNDPSKTAVAELDIFPDLNYLALAEVEFNIGDTLENARQNLPEWFQEDVTSLPQFKVKNLVGIQNLDEINGLDPQIKGIMKGLRSNLQRFYQGTILGENLKVLEDQTRDKTFVLLGSFKRFLPQFRRIAQDLERRSKGIYPPISTLDIARRQGSRTTDHNDAAFRIQAEEEIPLEEAEANYLKRIRQSDAVLVVAPDRRLGKSSGQELVYALHRGKEAYLSGPIERVADDLSPPETRVLVASLIAFEISKHDHRLRTQSITPTIIDIIKRIYKKEDGSFDEEAVKALVQATIDDLLKASKEEDDLQIELNQN